MDQIRFLCHVDGRHNKILFTSSAILHFEHSNSSTSISYLGSITAKSPLQQIAFTRSQRTLIDLNWPNNVYILSA